MYQFKSVIYMLSLCVSLILTTLSSTIYAAESPYTYGSASIGNTYGNLPNDFGFEASGIGYNFAIGRQVSDYVAVELGYESYGELEEDFDGGVSTIDGSGFNLSALLFLPLSEKISVYGRAGMFIWEGEGNVECDSNVSAVFCDFSGSESGADAQVGFGAQYSFSPTMLIKGEYKVGWLEGFDDETDEVLELSMTSVGLVVLIN